ncbi:amidase [Hydrocarboniphaga effusa]|uniref:amidase n=1 Tax=Hydrocarboniphaga effusa TaxID=243629 RepID=UPI003137FDE9
MFKPNTTPSLSRRRFLGSSVTAAGGALALAHFSPAFAALASGDVLTLSATAVAAKLRKGEISATELVKRCYARIDEVNPTLNAVVFTCRERAYAEAAELDKMLAAGKTKGPLHGVPFTIKDSFDTGGVVSTGGTLGRKQYVPGADATVVARLRDAGGILLGKSNTPEFTLGGGARGTYNLVYGQTYNAYGQRYSPAGSSGGAGAIVAAGGAYFDIGSDYGGSIRGPSNFNGIAGIKPTYGRVPRTGHIVGYGGAYDNFQETGPMARYVEDLALLLPIVAGPDASDAAMAPVPLADPGKVEIGKLRVAYYLSDGVTEPSAEIKAMVTQCVGYFQSAGCRVKQDMPPKMKELSDARRRYSGASGGDNMRRLLKKHGSLQASPGLRLDGDEISSAEFTAACEAMDAIKSEQLTWFEQYDLIVCPSSATAPKPVPPEFTRAPNGPNPGGGYNSQYNTTGWPAGVVRATTSKDEAGLPLGIQVVAQPWRDDVVIAALAMIEKQTGGYRAPTL